MSRGGKSPGWAALKHRDARIVSGPRAGVLAVAGPPYDSWTVADVGLSEVEPLYTISLTGSAPSPAPVAFSPDARWFVTLDLIVLNGLVDTPAASAGALLDWLKQAQLALEVFPERARVTPLVGRVEAWSRSGES